MEKLLIKYKERCEEKSDINEHIPTLYRFASECSHITEIGVRHGCSSVAFLLSNPNKFIGYDVIKYPEIDELISLSKEYNINYQFVLADVLSVEMEPTELLFIDTLHTYHQLTSELNLHSDKVSKYIILHDTETYGYLDEKMFVNPNEPIDKNIRRNVGLVNAVKDFLESEKGSNWIIHEVYDNNNGLTILKKVT